MAKDSWVVEVQEQVREGGWWSLNFSRQLHDFELKGVTTFLQKLQMSAIRRGEDVRMG